MELFDYAINIYECSIILFFLFSWATKKKILVPSIIFVAAEFGIITFSNYYSIPAVIYSAIDIIFCWLYLKIISDMRNSNAFLIAVIPDLIISISNELYTVFLYLILQPAGYEAAITNNRYLIVILINAIHLLLFYAAQREIHKHPLALKNSDAFLAALLLVTCYVMSLCFESALFQQVYSSMYMTLGIISVFVLCALICTFFIRINKQQQTSLEESFELEQLRQDRAVSEQVMDAREQLYQLRHDIKHFMTLINAEEESVSEETKKQSELLMKKLGESHAPISTPSAPITCALNLKYDEAVNQHIEMKCSVNLTRALAMEDSELYLLISNMLDNAVKHVGGERTISVDIHESNEMCIIIITNSVDANAKPKTNHTISEHGHGLTTVARIIKMNDGIIHYAVTDTSFTVSLALHLSSITTEKQSNQ